jgi:type VI secretion system protein ImpM
MSPAEDGARVGVYGKVGTQADFLRINAGAFIDAGLDRLLEEAVETLRSERSNLPQEPTGFVLTSRDRGAFVGAFAPSHDAVGRSFPLAVFASIPSTWLARAWSALPALLEGVVRAAKDVVASGQDLSEADLSQRIQDLSGVVSSTDASLALGDVTWPADEPLSSLRSVVGGDAPLAYAFRTFGAACDQAAKAGPRPTTGTITLDAPVPTLADFGLWLEIASRRLGWGETVPSMLWTDGPAGRLLLTMGLPVAPAFAFLANPRHRSPRFWPLRTDVTAAVDKAFGALAPNQKLCVENQASTLADAAAAFGEGTSERGK